MRMAAIQTTRMLLIGLAPVLAAMSGCVPEVECANESESATPNVAGTFRYGGNSVGYLSGTITFEQEGDLVRVTETTYDVTLNREVIGEAYLVGNRLDIPLTPSNGATDYRADVTFIFSDDGSTFCVEFSDTNGDEGPLGSFTGERI